MAFSSDLGGAEQGFVNNSEGATNPHKKTYQLDTRARCVRKVYKLKIH